MDRYIQYLAETVKGEVEEFMANGKHFSHDHPLSLTIPSEEDDEEDDKSCSICGLPILSSPYYNCSTIPCKFFLHHQCALNLPHFLHMLTYCDIKLNGHTLVLEQSLSSSSSDFNYECIYCGIKIHPLSAGAGVEIEIKHRSHPSHPLVATHKEVSCECDGCGREHKGFFFTCSKGCNFWIHRDCTLLPNIITLLHQPYPFFLAYSLSPFQISDVRCVVCRKPLLARSSNLGLYVCPQSRRFAHVPCGTHDKSASKTRAKVMMQLPEEELDEFPSKVIRKYAETIVGTSTARDRQTIESYHKQHQLILIDNNNTSTSTGTKKKNKRKLLLACDLCTQPIDTSSSSPFHRCRDTACQFAAHKICADILPGITKSFIPGTFIKGTKYLALIPINHLGTPVFFNSVFYCHFCRRPCNGAYTFARTPLSFQQPLHIDLECMAAPITVNHASHSHPQHILFRTHNSPWAVGDAPALSCCTADTFLYDIYQCLACNYSIHISCAMLPKRLHFPQYHRRHPLCLIYGNIDGGHDFCEVCEEVIDLRYWLYRCVECDESYHINCIPSVGYLSKVKFGGTLTLPSSVHVHPLTLERMLDVPSQRCGNCKEIIHGRVDEMAFFCSLCHFWLHFSCAGKSASYPLPLYSDVGLKDDRSSVNYMLGRARSEETKRFSYRECTSAIPCPPYDESIQKANIEGRSVKSPY